MYKLLLSILSFNILIVSYLSAQKYENRTDFEQDYYESVTQEPRERIYVHNDKPYYFTGETIWFKVYCFDGTYELPSNISKLAYIELLSDDNTPVFQEKIMMEKGTGNGQFFINSKIGTGIYTIRGYTSLMRNRDEHHFFEKEIKIVNPFKPNFDDPPKASAWRISFFPEGGKMINGLESRVAFKVNDDLGTGILTEGFLVDDQGNRVALLSTSERGVGSFSFIPEPGVAYKAVFNDGQRSYEEDLPKSNNAGINLSLDHQLIQQNLQIKVQSTNADQVVYVMIHSRGVMHLLEKRRLFEQKVSLDVSEERLAPGINNITVFNENFEPVAERPFFVYPEVDQDLSIKPSKRNYEGREKVSLTLNSKNPIGDVSVAVYRNHKPLESTDDNPFSLLLLNTELAKSIPEVDYFFDERSIAVKKELDTELMVYGWSDFQEETKDEFLPEINSPIISGKLIGGDTIQNNTVMALFPGKDPQLYTFQPGENNRFSFEVSPFIKSGDILFWSDEIDLENYKIELVEPFVKADQSELDKYVAVDQEMLDIIQDYSVNVQIMNAYAAENQSRGMLNGRYSLESPFYGTADVSYYLDDYTRFPQLDEVFKEYIRYADPRKRNNKVAMYVKDFDYKSVDPNIPALTLIDGVPITDVNVIWEFDQAEVEKIDIVHRRFTHLHKEFHGIVSIGTFKGNLGGNSIPDYVIQKLYDGLQRPRKFYSPNYDKALDERIPDYRSLLHWEPNPEINENGVVELEFFTSDADGEYMIEVFGYSTKGSILFDQEKIEVKNEIKRQ